MKIKLESRNGARHELIITSTNDKLIISDKDGNAVAELWVETGSTTSDGEKPDGLMYNHSFYLHFEVSDSDMANGSGWATARVDEKEYEAERAAIEMRIAARKTRKQAA